jgi:hypothetical protein
MNFHLKPHEHELLKAIIQLCAIISSIFIFLFLIKAKRDTAKWRKDHQKWLQQLQPIQFYKIKANQSHKQYLIAYKIGCLHKPEYLNKIPCNSVLGSYIRQFEFDNCFDIILE